MPLQLEVRLLEQLRGEEGGRLTPDPVLRRAVAAAGLERVQVCFGGFALSEKRLRTPGVSPGVKAASRRLVKLEDGKVCYR
jgi:hypothetical protein